MSKRKSFFLILFSFLALTVLSAWVALPLLLASRRGASLSAVHDRFSSAELALLREGDIILRRGDSLASDLIVRFMGSGTGVSHCALVLSPGAALIESIPEDRISFLAGRGSLSAGRLAVIHAVSDSLSKVDGIQLEDLGRFNQRSAAASLVVLRPRMAEAQLSVYVSSAKAMLASSLPFDNFYRLDPEGPLYCSELFHRAFAAAAWEGQGAWRENRGILSFDSFLDGRHYEVILSHNPRISPAPPL